MLSIYEKRSLALSILKSRYLSKRWCFACPPADQGKYQHLEHAEDIVALRKKNWLQEKDDTPLSLMKESFWKLNTFQI